MSYFNFTGLALAQPRPREPVWNSANDDGDRTNATDEESSLDGARWKHNLEPGHRCPTGSGPCPARESVAVSLYGAVIIGRALRGSRARSGREPPSDAHTRFRLLRLPAI